VIPKQGGGLIARKKSGQGWKIQQKVSIETCRPGRRNRDYRNETNRQDDSREPVRDKE